MPMVHRAHHQGSTPTNHDAQLCATCVAVLPALQVPAAQPDPPFAAYVSPVTPLSGFDPALDPPPPRGAWTSFGSTFEMENIMKKLIAAVVLLTASAGAFAAVPAVAHAMTDCPCPCPDGK
jgi:hypothetical protein